LWKSAAVIMQKIGRKSSIKNQQQHRNGWQQAEDQNIVDKKSKT